MLLNRLEIERAGMVNRAEETADLKTPLAQSQRPVLSGMLSVLLIFNKANVFVSCVSCGGYVWFF